MKRITVLIAGLMFVVLVIGTYTYTAEITADPTPFESAEETYEQSEPIEIPLSPATNNRISYSLQNEELNVTYDGGTTWLQVPFDSIEKLFAGEYTGDQTELIEGSSILTEDFTAFLYAEDTHLNSDVGSKVKDIFLKYSKDQGETWHDSLIAASFPPPRFRKTTFLNEEFGYVILSGGRTMGQESSVVFLSHDGGETWEETANAGVTLLIYEGGFVDEYTGFLSYGTINPEQPELFVTQDGGNTWNKAEITIPEDYKRIFVSAEMPYQEDNHLAVLLNQGSTGDYKGGRVKGKFVSENNGLTWEFLEEVDPDERE